MDFFRSSATLASCPSSRGIMKPVEKHAALELLADELPLVHSCIKLGWDDFMSEYSPAQRLKMSSRSRASVVHDLIVLRARETFETHIGAQCLDKEKMFVVAFHAGAAIRFKKLDERFLASGIGTSQALDFMAQEALPGIPEYVYLQAGYRLNGLETDLEGIYLTCPRGRSANYWWHELGADAQDASDGLVLPFPTPGDSGLDAAPYEIVRRGGEEDDAASKR